MNVLRAFAVVCALVVGGCGSTPTVAPSGAEATSYLGGVAKPVGERLWIGAQPGAADFAALKAAGITRVINFRTPPEMDELGFDEPQILSELGIEYLNIPMGGDDYGYTPAQVDALASALDGSDDKVLLHCTVGWRASIVTIAYLVREQGMPLDEAMTHAQRWWPLQLEHMLGRPLKLQFAGEAAQ